MEQLRINGITYPEAESQDYKCYYVDNSSYYRMISMREVAEVKKRVCVIEYSYRYFDVEFLKKCLTDLRAGKPLETYYFDPNTMEMEYGLFRCKEWPQPVFLFTDRDDVPFFGEISFTLESVEGV